MNFIHNSTCISGKILSSLISCTTHNIQHTWVIQYWQVRLIIFNAYRSPQVPCVLVMNNKYSEENEAFLNAVSNKYSINMKPFGESHSTALRSQHSHLPSAIPHQTQTFIHHHYHHPRQLHFPYQAGQRSRLLKMRPTVTRWLEVLVMWLLAHHSWTCPSTHYIIPELILPHITCSHSGSVTRCCNSSLCEVSSNTTCSHNNYYCMFRTM